MSKEPQSNGIDLVYGSKTKRLAPSLERRGDRANLILAFLSSTVYVCLRLIFHGVIKAAGYQDGGLISYDSYYHYAFAQELIRSGNHVFFQNPFGSLDNAPHLFNLYASILRLFHPLYAKNLFPFDCAVGALAVFASSLCLLKLLSNLGIIEKLIVLFGGGVAFIGMFLGWVSVENALWAGFWGLTHVLNQISTPEIIYHAIFFLGLYCLIVGKNLWVFCVVAVLILLHPFTALIFNFSVGTAWLYQCIRTRKIINRRLRPFLYAVSSAAVIILLYRVYLPSISKDAEFYRVSYENMHFYIDNLEYALFLILPISYFLWSLFFRKKSQRVTQPESLWIFAGTSIFCIVMSASYMFTDKIVQPAHWSRVYPYVFIFALGGVFAGQGTRIRASKVSTAFKIFLLFIAVLDSALGVTYFGKALLREKRPPLFLTQDQSKIIETAKTIPSGMFLYLRDGLEDPQVGDFEYAMMALTSQKGFLGHTQFSPFFGSITPYLFPRRQGYRMPTGLLRRSKYIVLDKKLFDSWNNKGWGVLYRGKELVFVSNAEN